MPSVAFIVPENGIIGIYSGVYGSAVTFSINGFYYGFYSGNTEKSGGGSFSRIVNKGDVISFSGSGPYGWGKSISYEFVPFKKS